MTLFVGFEQELVQFVKINYRGVRLYLKAPWLWAYQLVIKREDENKTPVFHRGKFSIITEKVDEPWFNFVFLDDRELKHVENTVYNYK